MNTHSKSIASAALKTLKPIGLFQNGRSRMWLGDHGWWLDVVEFQPSTRSKGSYLNVSCMWLWREQPFISFDEGKIRETGFESFKNDQQFALIAEMLAEKAKERVLHYRDLFPSIRAVSDFYLRKESHSIKGWEEFNAAVAHGFCGRSDEALALFSSFSNGLDHSIEWQKNADEVSRFLASIVYDTRAFQQTTRDRVARSRELLKLPPTQVDFETAELTKPKLGKNSKA